MTRAEVLGAFSTHKAYHYDVDFMKKKTDKHIHVQFRDNIKVGMLDKFDVFFERSLTLIQLLIDFLYYFETS